MKKILYKNLVWELCGDCFRWVVYHDDDAGFCVNTCFDCPYYSKKNMVFLFSIKLACFCSKKNWPINKFPSKIPQWCPLELEATKEEVKKYREAKDKKFEAYFNRTDCR